MSLLVKIGKKIVKKYIKKIKPEKHFLSYTTRIERIKTNKRICAMTFDDGPMNLPASPDMFNGRSVTDLILDTLKEFNAKGTFDIVGDTSKNYPDKAGKLGSPSWGGTHYDHYPDINLDKKGGAINNQRLIKRIIKEGHQITNHGYRHIIFGPKKYIYEKRIYFNTFEEALKDIKKLDNLMLKQYNYQMTLSRPPHYVDKIKNGYTSYDIYDLMNYHYLGASFDGGGWLPSIHKNEKDAHIAEINTMITPIKKALENNPDFFCGQIIFQKDGYNMSKRTPIVFALKEQLKILKEYNYQVVTVDELLKESPFEDVGKEHPMFNELCILAQNKAIVYQDNKLRLSKIMTNGELAMLICPKKEAINRRQEYIKKNKKHIHPYYGAMSWCIENGFMNKKTNIHSPVTSLNEKLFAPCQTFTRENVYKSYISKNKKSLNILKKT